MGAGTLFFVVGCPNLMALSNRIHLIPWHGRWIHLLAASLPPTPRRVSCGHLQSILALVAHSIAACRKLAELRWGLFHGSTAWGSDERGQRMYLHSMIGRTIVFWADTIGVLCGEHGAQRWPTNSKRKTKMDVETKRISQTTRNRSLRTAASNKWNRIPFIRSFFSAYLFACDSSNLADSSAHEMCGFAEMDALRARFRTRVCVCVCWCTWRGSDTKPP